MHEKGFYLTAMGHSTESSIAVVVIVMMALYTVSNGSSLSSCKHDIFGVRYKKRLALVAERESESVP